MRDIDPCRAAGGGETAKDPVQQAQHLVALARQARLLEFALDGHDDAGQRLAAEIEAALERAMEAESGAELTDACAAVESSLAAVAGSGMRLSVQMADVPVEGVLGTALMPVLTAVLSSTCGSPRA